MSMLEKEEAALERSWRIADASIEDVVEVEEGGDGEEASGVEDEDETYESTDSITARRLLWLVRRDATSPHRVLRGRWTRSRDYEERSESQGRLYWRPLKTTSYVRSSLICQKRSFSAHLKELKRSRERRLSRGKLAPPFMLLDEKVGELLVLRVPSRENLGDRRVEGDELLEVARHEVLYLEDVDEARL